MVVYVGGDVFEESGGYGGDVGWEVVRVEVVGGYAVGFGIYGEADERGVGGILRGVRLSRLRVYGLGRRAEAFSFFVFYPLRQGRAGGESVRVVFGYMGGVEREKLVHKRKIRIFRPI